MLQRKRNSHPAEGQRDRAADGEPADEDGKSGGGESRGGEESLGGGEESLG